MSTDVDAARREVVRRRTHVSVVANRADRDHYLLGIAVSTIPLPASHAKNSSAETTGFPYS
jgi:hypothetical protein